MTVVITDRRTTVDSAESTTGWTGAGYGVTTISAEGTNAVAEALNIATGQVYFTAGAGADLAAANPLSSGTLVYVQSFNNALQDPWDASPPAHALLLGDGTNRIGFDMAGADRRVFNHLESVDSSLDCNSWQCLVLDSAKAGEMDANGNTYVVNGSFASLDFTSIVDFGSSFDTNSKALGGGYNVAVDVIRYGNLGIVVGGGTTSLPGNCFELASGDADTTTGHGHGIFRQLNPVSFGCQGPLCFGEANTASDARFSDAGVTISYEDRNIADDKYFISIEGNSGATNKFELSNSTITTAGPYIRFEATSGNLDTLNLSAVNFTSLGGIVNFSNQVDGSGHYIAGCTFSGCDRIYPGTTNFTNNSISNSVASGDGALLLDQTCRTDRFSGLSFTSTGVGYAIEVSESGYYTFTNYTYSGYGSIGTTNAAINNSSGNSVVVNVTGGDSPTYHNSAVGSETTIVANVTITVTVIDEAGDPVENAQVALYVDGTQVMNEDTLATGVATEDYGGTTPTQAVLRIRKGSSTDSPKYLPISSTQTIGSDGLTVTITLIEDTNNNS